MTSKRDLERQIERLELATRLGVSPEEIDLSKRDRKHFDELLEDLDDKQRQELDAIAARLEREAVDENPSACGLTEAGRDFLDVLTARPP